MWSWVNFERDRERVLRWRRFEQRVLEVLMEFRRVGRELVRGVRGGRRWEVEVRRVWEGAESWEGVGEWSGGVEARSEAKCRV